MQRHIPSRFRPKLYAGYAVAGICLIRLEHIRPKLMPRIIGLNSENAAHRVAVLWDEGGTTREGVFISRRDTDSRINHLLGGRVFPGEHHPAEFKVTESDSEIKLTMESADGEVAVEIAGGMVKEMPTTSIFRTIAEASSFFQSGSLGYSVTSDPNRLDGLKLETEEWRVAPLRVTKMRSSYFADTEKFPKASVEFDHAIIMRDVSHEWHSAGDLYI